VIDQHIVAETAHVDPSRVGLDGHVRQIVDLIEYEDMFRTSRTAANL
jgi:hypothetical protein